MATSNTVRASRDGDQFHYVWAARHCLKLLSGRTNLVALTIEGASTSETEGSVLEEGDELIDVGFYYGAETIEAASAIRYVQLKHSTRQTALPWTASGLEKTVRGFSERYTKLVADRTPDVVGAKFAFSFTTNRPLEVKLAQTLEDLAKGADARHPALADQLIEYTGLEEKSALSFFTLFSAEGYEDDLWVQRNLLAEDVRAYLPDSDGDAPIQLKELVSRKATTEFSHDPSIRRYDILRALKVSEDDLEPAPNLIPNFENAFAREQEEEILSRVLASSTPVIIHADGGVGKSIFAARLVALMPDCSHAVLYDCYGDGLYRSAHNFRHRHRDAFTQIANELAAEGLCHPLIPSVYADVKSYIRAFTHRLKQAIAILRARAPGASLCVIIDAADNAQMAAEDQRETHSFVMDLIQMPLPTGVRLIMTSRSHRRDRLKAPPATLEIELKPFSLSETATHLRRSYPTATDTEVAEFAYLSSSNPRVQALAMEQALTLPEMLRQLGPNPTTIAAAIGDLLASAIKRLKDKVADIDGRQIDDICRGLAVLRPLVPLAVLTKLSGVNEGAVRSFASDLGRPLLVRGDSVHFMDEPAETWFRDNFTPDAGEMKVFIERLRPLASQSSYVASTLPQLMLEAGFHDELVALALSTDALPTDNPLERRDVELQRLTFALKASLLKGTHLAAAKLALKAAGEAAGEDRQRDLIQENVHLAAALLPPNRLQELVSRGTFGASWMGSHHIYDAVILSGREEFGPDASSRLRMALDWLNAWARQPDDPEDEGDRRGDVGDEDRAAFVLAILRLRGAKDAAGFLRRWRHRPLSFSAGRIVTQHLIDLGQFDQIPVLASAAGNDIWLLLALAHAARSCGRPLPSAALSRLLRLLMGRRVQLPEYWNEKWDVLEAVCSAVELSLDCLSIDRKQLANLVVRYLPQSPPHEFASRFPSNRASLLRCYALEAALRGESLQLAAVAPDRIRAELERDMKNGGSINQDVAAFTHEVGGLLPWAVLSAEIRCGKAPIDFGEAIANARDVSTAAGRRGYYDDFALRNAVAYEWLKLLIDTGHIDEKAIADFVLWKTSQSAPFWPETLIRLCSAAGKTTGLENFAIDLATEARQALENSREDAESRTASYLILARAVFSASPPESSAYFDHAIEIASRIGQENLDRWAAFLNLAEAAAAPHQPRPYTAYRMSRAAELTYEYVVRDKHFAWDDTALALSKLCASSALTIFSRWRDRRFGDPGRLLPITVEYLVEHGDLNYVAPIALAGLDARWNRLGNLKRFATTEADVGRRKRGAEIAYTYMRTRSGDARHWQELQEIADREGWDFPDVRRLYGVSLKPADLPSTSGTDGSASWKKKLPNADWPAIFAGIDLTSSDDIATAFHRLRAYDPPYEFEAFFREAARRVRPGCEANYARAVATWPKFSILELRYFIDGLPDTWYGRLAFRPALRQAVLGVCRKEPTRVYRQGWYDRVGFKALFARGIVTDRDVVKACLEGFTVQADSLNAAALFRLLDPLAASLSPDEADEALHYGFDLLEPTLKPEDGDGPWKPELTPPVDPIDALAGYIWAGLASPIAGNRWEFAHIVRRVIELDWRELSEALTRASRLESGGPFRDFRLHFYVWHAREWLAIGLARGATENAAALAPFVDWLKAMLAEGHVVISAFVKACLVAWAEASKGRQDELSDLDAVNRSALPAEIYRSCRKVRDDEETGVTADDAECASPEDDKYYFGIDISPYWFGPMGQVFGLSETATEKRALGVLRGKMGWNGAGWRDDGRHTHKIFREGETIHRHGSMPATDDLTAYHGYHSMMLTAGMLLLEYPVGQEIDASRDDFETWLGSKLLTRQGGRWLSDRHDPRIVRDPPGNGTQGADWPWEVDKVQLDRQLLTDDGLRVLWGQWSAGNFDRKEHVIVRSALVSDGAAEALLASLQTSSRSCHFCLPASDLSDVVTLSAGRLVGWVTDDSAPRNLDEFDPWGRGLRFPAAAPDLEVIDRLKLKSDLDGREWRNPAEVRLRSEIWTVAEGYGREEIIDACWRLAGDHSFVEALLSAHEGQCLILSVAIRRDLPRYGSKGIFEAYPWPYTRFYIVRSDGVPTPL